MTTQLDILQTISDTVEQAEAAGIEPSTWVLGEDTQAEWLGHLPLEMIRTDDTDIRFVADEIEGRILGFLPLSRLPLPRKDG